jgi:hypothetical protein
MKIEAWTLKEFSKHAREYWPQACKTHELPTSGCMPAVKAWLEAAGIGIPGFMARLKTADGDRAWALYECAAQGWLPGEQAINLIKTAPGDRALALYYCAVCGWIPSAEALPLIKSAPGDRAVVLYHCADQGWISYKEVETYLETR